MNNGFFSLAAHSSERKCGNVELNNLKWTKGQTKGFNPFLGVNQSSMRSTRFCDKQMKTVLSFRSDEGLILKIGPKQLSDKFHAFDQ